LKITKSSDPLPVERINLCIYGAPGLGKTTLAFTAESPLLLDCDGGAHRAKNRKDTVRVSSWADIAAIEQGDLAPYKTVILDTAGRALDFLTGDIIAKNPKLGRGGALTLQGFGELKTRFSSYLKMLRTFGKDVVLIAHMDEQRSGDDVIERLDVQGGSKGEIYKSVDAMGRIYMQGNEWKLDFNPRENSFGKNPCNLPVMPVLLSSTNLLGEVNATIKDRLNQESEKSKEANAEMEKWAKWVSDCTRAEEINQLLPKAKDATQAIRSLVASRAKTLKLVWNGTSLRYESQKETANAA